MVKLDKYASHFFKQECMRARLEVYQNENGERGVDFILKTKSGKYIEIDLRTINLETTDRSIKIPKADWNHELPENRYVAFVAFMKELEPAIYLIPCKAFERPNQFLIDNAQSKRFEHLSNWEIKVIPNQMREFGEKYGWSNVVSTLN